MQRVIGALRLTVATRGSESIQLPRGPMKIVKPIRAVHTYTQRLIAQPDAVFPLLCPVREADWIEGWEPRLVASESGVAERDCVFVTPAQPADAVWYITRHGPESGFVEMVKITPNVTACRLSIQLRAVEGAGVRGGYHLRPYQPRTGRRRLRCVLYGRLLSSVHAGLGVAAQSFLREGSALRSDGG